MKKLFLAASFMLATTAFVHAGIVQTLTVNGEQVKQTVVSMSFDGDNTVLHFADQTTLSVDMEQVVLAFELDTTTAIYSLQQAVADRLDLSGLEPGTEVVVFDTGGKKVLTTTAGETSAVLSAKSLKSGVYLLKAGKQVVKFIKR